MTPEELIGYIFLIFSAVVSMLMLWDLFFGHAQTEEERKAVWKYHFGDRAEEVYNDYRKL